MFQIIQNFVEFTNYVEFFEFNEHFDVGNFIQRFVQENDFDIHLLYVSIVQNCYNEQNFVNHEFNDNCKNLVEINFITLFEITNYSTSFVF